ncbi:MAG: MFS transporter [Candidatus Rokubacteria bacterium]|nr:MFS transporter [Candidatus Rokubacteria bacterium]
MTTDRPVYAWIVLASAFVIISAGIGALFSLGVFLKPIEDATGWSRASISGIAFFNWVVMGVGSLFWGNLSDRIGTRLVALMGGVLLGLGLVLSSRVTLPWQFYLSFGLLVGLGVSAFYVPLTSTVTTWFAANRGLAAGIVSAGNGFGLLVISPLSRWLISTFDWRAAMLILGNLTWLVVIPAALFIRNSPGERTRTLEATPAAATPDGSGFTAGAALSSFPLWVIALTHFACCAAHSGPIFHMVSHAMDQGIPNMAAAGVLGASGLSSIPGRIGFGVLADRIGAKPVLVTGLAAQAVMIFAYLLADDLATFYVLALLFGVTYGGVMPLYAVVTREYFGQKVMGTAYGAVFFISSVGMGVGSFAGGWFHDNLGSYAWLYLSSFAIGGMASLLAATLRPPRAITSLTSST